MKPNLRILLIEDNAADAELIAHELKASGLSFRLGEVHTEGELLHELQSEKPDVILSDHGFPSFSGFKALEIAREKCPEMPFIFVSGSNDQGMVARMYEQGATDYVFKRDLGDLKSAVVRALEPPAPATPVERETPSAAAPTGVFSRTTYLDFCPKCLQAHDDSGERVPLAEYFRGGQIEVVIVRKVCAKCE